MWWRFRAKARKMIVPAEVEAVRPGENHVSVDEFARAFDALGDERRAMLAGPGVRLDELPAAMFDRIVAEITGAPGGKLSPDQEGLVRVHVTKVSGARHLTITAPANLATTVYGPDPIGQPGFKP
jgi:hypothetical protein